jgi:hypothetical protein
MQYLSLLTPTFVSFSPLPILTLASESFLSLDGRVDRTLGMPVFGLALASGIGGLNPIKSEVMSAFFNVSFFGIL